MIEAKETVVGSLGATKQSLRGTTNASSVYTSEYKLPVASENTLGGIMVGENLNIEDDGTLNAIVPTKVSELENDSGYLTEVPAEYITDIELAQKGYLTEVPSEYKTKEENDNLYQRIGDYASRSDIPEVPTKLSELENDSGFISEVPEEYITESELNEKGYLTEHQDISNLATKDELHTHSNKSVLDSISQENIDSWNSGTGGSDIDLTDYAKKSEVPTKTSQLENDSKFISVKNLFNKNGDISYNLTYVSNGEATRLDNSFIQNDYIPVLPSKSYTMSTTNDYTSEKDYRLMICQYDSNKNFIRTTMTSKNKTDRISTSANTYYVRLCASTVTIDELQFELGSVATPYVPYFNLEEKTHSHSNKSVLDSITQENIDSWNSGTGGGSGTTDYVDLSNKPSINGVELNGNKTTSDLGISVPTKTSDLTNDSGFISSVPSEYITETELSSKNYATKSELHSHSNKSVLDSITQANINAWNSASGGSPTPNIMTIKKTTKQTLPKETYNKILFDVSSGIGNKLTFTDNGIQIGSGVSKVKISCFATVQNNDVGVIHIKIVKNSHTNENTIGWINDITPLGGWSATLTIPQSLVEVNAGEVICVYVYTSGVGGVGSLNGVPTANLTVEVIE